MALSVTRKSSFFVKAAEPTPSHQLRLSAIDKLSILKHHARTMHVFRSGDDVVEAVQRGLARALVPYYPLAGRLGESSQGETQIECTGEGIWLTEASTESRLQDFGYFNDGENVPFDQLLPDDQSPDDKDPLVKLQVTQFENGGFVIGLSFCHAICDGLGAAQFLVAVGELARGLSEPSIAPVWSRDFTPRVPSQPSNTSIFTGLPPPSYHLLQANIDISVSQIQHLKQEFKSVTNEHCSGFEAIAAKVWKARTTAVRFMQETELKLIFFANCRHLVQPHPLPQGFYGNCFFPVIVTAQSNLIEESSVTDIVRLIRSAKNNLATEFGKYMTGAKNGTGAESDDGNPFGPMPTYNTLFLSEWGRLGFNAVDYGFGPPSLVVPLQGSAAAPAAIVGMPPWPKEGLRLTTWCVAEDHFGSFMDQMNQLISDPEY